VTDRFDGKPAWRTASRCDGGSCIEVADLDEEVMLRDSANPATVISVGCKEWREFLARIIADVLDER
jgi:hypothetical protein